MKFKRGDKVKVVSGRYVGKRGTVIGPTFDPYFQIRVISYTVELWDIFNGYVEFKKSELQHNDISERYCDVKKELEYDVM